MDKRLVLVVSGERIAEALSNARFVGRGWVPLGKATGWVGPDCQVLLRFRTSAGSLALDDSASIVAYKDAHYLRSQAFVSQLQADPPTGKYVFFVMEGCESVVRVTVHVAEEAIFDELNESDPTLRLTAYSLPPPDSTLLDVARLVRPICTALHRRDPELYPRRTDEFVQSPHILISMLSHVMELSSKDQIPFVSTLRVAADQMRQLLQPYIRRIERSHQELWAEWYGSRISFADGGMARVSGIPSSAPMAMRVGIYTVVPGETDPHKREKWQLEPYVTGDIVNSPPDPDRPIAEPPNRRRLLEASRYILELLTVVRHVESQPAPEIVFLHGPLVNTFEMYDEGEPNYIPSVDPDFLGSYGIDHEEVNRTIASIPTNSRNEEMWNHCMAVYGYLLKRVFDTKIPLVGVVERSASTTFSRAVLDELRERGATTRDHARRLWDAVRKFKIQDDLLFGCILDEGEYIDPILLHKNVARRAREPWQPVVGQYPNPHATYLKTSATTFPFRVEFNGVPENGPLERIMRLLFHTSLLLPDYAFPAGLDIVDKYAKVPDWLSRGVSTAAAAQILAKAWKTGEPKVLYQVRRLLSQSPRDFYFRPTA